MHRDTNSAVRPAVALQRELRQVSAGTMPLKEPKESSSKGSMQLPIKNPVSTNTEKLSTRTKHITTWVISLQRWGPRDPYFFYFVFDFVLNVLPYISLFPQPQAQLGRGNLKRRVHHQSFITFISCKNMCL